MLINLRNALMAGKRLPYDAEVEYLQSTGTQYINTGYVPNGSETIMVTGAMTGTSSNSGLFGSVGSTGANVYLGASGSQSKFNSGWGSTVRTAGTFDTNLHAFETGLLRGFWCDGVLLDTFGTNSQAYGKTIALFMRDNGYPAYARISHFYIEGIIDLIPVRKGTVGYLYDRVSGRLFGNAGTGDFVLGPDVVPVEYIQGNKYSATSGPWIDTGLNPSICNDSILECKVAFELLPYTRDQYTGIFGAAVPRFGAYAIDDKLSFGYSSSYDNIVTISRNQVYNLDFESTKGAQSAHLNGEKIWTGTGSSTLSNSYSIGLFCRNAATPAWQNNLRIYNCKFNIDGTPARSFRPVRVGSGSTWEGAMMDVLTRRIYRNAGTGAFTYGNDI